MVIIWVASIRLQSIAAATWSRCLAGWVTSIKARRSTRRRSLLVIDWLFVNRIPLQVLVNFVVIAEREHDLFQDAERADGDTVVAELKVALSES